MEGLWTVEFGSTIGQFGAGVVVLQNGIVRGGDNAYYYTGTYEQHGSRFTLIIDATPFVEDIESIFKTLGTRLRLNISGLLKQDGRNAVGQGTIDNHPQIRVGIKFTKRT